MGHDGILILRYGVQIEDRDMRMTENKVQRESRENNEGNVSGIDGV